MLFSGEQSIPETEYLVRLYIILAVNNTGCKQHGHQGPCCLQHTLVAKASPSEQHRVVQTKGSAPAFVVVQ